MPASDHLTTPLSLDSLVAARSRLVGVLRPTPAYLSDSLSALAGRPVILKPEHQQRTGSFKIRGAYNRIAQIPEGVDVVAASAGNHAQGVALAATLTGRGATVFMPRGAALPKVAATRAYGATVRFEGDVLDEAIAVAREYAVETGAVYVPPFDDPDVVAGQATVGLEILDEAPEVEVIVVPVGGGGLIGGVAVAAALGSKAAGRSAPVVVGVEAAGAPTLSEAMAAGRPVTLGSVATIADGIAVAACSELTFALAQEYVETVVTVDEEEISRAVLQLVERAKAVVEPSGATGLAALLAGRVPGDGPVALVLSGGNVDPLLLAKLIEHGLAAAGRYLTVRVVVPDKAGALAGLTQELAHLGLNVLEIRHDRSNPHLAVSEVQVQATVETRDHDHQAEVIQALSDAGYRAEPVS